MTTDGSCSYTWDAEGRQTGASGTICSTASYVYDGDGRRVKKIVGSTTTLFWPDLGGNVLTETDGAGSLVKDYIYFAGQRLAYLYSSSAKFYFGGQIGTGSVITYDNGTICYDADFYPFGGERTPYVNTCPPSNYGQNYKFAGTERDSESQNDHTMFRYYASNYGRWLSPDPLAGGVTNPQSLNRYAYVLNNPTNLIDPLGASNVRLQAPETPACTGPGCAQWGNDIFDAISGAAGYYVFNTPTGLGFGFDIGSPALSPFQWQVSGTLYGKPVEEYGQTTFDTFDDYAYWRTGVAALPESQAYIAYLLDCQHSTTACTGGETLATRYQGPTGNYALVGSSLNPASTAGMIRDPSLFSNPMHGGPSWYTWDFLDAGHVATTPAGYVESHTDAFNGVLGAPFHFVFDVVPSFFINPKPGVAGPSYSCSRVGGCN